MSYDIDHQPGMSYGRTLLTLFGFLLLGMVAGSLFSASVWTLMTGRGIATLSQDMLDPHFANALRIMQLVSSLFLFFLPAWGAIRILHRSPMRFMGFQQGRDLRMAGLVVLVMAACLPMVGSLSELNRMIPVPSSYQKVFQDMEDSYMRQMKAMARMGGFMDYLSCLLIMAFIPALFEESFFRGGMQNLLQRMTSRPWVAVIVTSLVFSAIHFSYYGFIPRFALGLVLGLLFQYSGSLWMSILGHFLNNAVVVTYIYWLTLHGRPIEEAMDDSQPLWYGLPATLAIVGLMVLYRRRGEQIQRGRMSPEDRSREEKWLA
ncbi:MAG: CPBP family intramembrane metalloprotease [Chitinophagia bacterium]|nr:CPBP family intramembrane metalloprotease [Chitinophagia bacterium]